MRLFSALGMSLLASLSLTACGDDGKGGGGTIDAPKQIDAAAIDAPPPAPCPPPTFGMGTFGTAAAPMSGAWVTKSMSGAISFGVGLIISQDMMNAVTFVLPKPTAGFAAGTFTFTTDPKAMMPVAVSFFEGGLDPANTMADAKHFLWPTSGSMTLTAVTKGGALPAGQNAGDKFTGSVSAVTYKEIDPMTGDPIAGGCMTMLGGVSFVMTQMTAVSVPPPPSGPTNWREAEVTRVPAFTAVAQ